jgi:hypothetical protein
MASSSTPLPVSDDEPELTDQETSEPKRKKRRLNEELWSHTRPPKDNEPVRNKHGQEIYYCKHCTRYKGTSASVRFREHLQANHAIRVSPTEQSASRTAFDNTIEDIFGKQAEQQKGRDIEQEKHLRAAIQVPEFEEACARLIAVRNLPHTLLDWPEFWAVILSVNYVTKDILKLARKDVPKLIESTYFLHREQLLKKLQNALSWIHFSIDMWTSPAKTGFQAVVVHWADADTRRVETALLSLREFKGSHGGEEQAKVFLEVIQEAGLRDKLGMFTMDNHTSNDKMLRHISEEIENFDPILRRVRCYGHILNLTVQAFLFGSSRQSGEDRENEEDAIDQAIREVSQLSRNSNLDTQDRQELAREWRRLGSLGKLHSINVWARASTERYNGIVAAIGRAIPLDNDTRWNSWFKEVEVALLNRRKLRDWIDQHYDDLGDDVLSREDWQELEDISEFLQPFVHCTLDTQGFTATLDRTFESMEFVIKHFADMKLKHRNNPRMVTRILASWFKFDKYYKLSDDTAVYAASILLHPELRQVFLEKSWDHQKEYVEPTVRAVRKVWRKYFKPDSSATLTVDLNTIKDPIRRCRLELTNSNNIVEEFEDFIKVRLQVARPLSIQISHLSNIPVIYLGCTYPAWNIPNTP